MRHLRRSRHFGRTSAHRRAMFDNMVTSLFIHERIMTTLPKAKELRIVAERLITLSKKNDVAARRLAARRLTISSKVEGGRTIHSEEALHKLFETIGPRFKDRPGGYTRIIKTVNRRGDCAPMALIELLPEEKRPAPKTKKDAEEPAA